MSFDAHTMSPAEALKAFRRGSLTPRAYLESLIEAHDIAGDAILAFAHLDLVGARRQADASSDRHARGAALSAIDGLPMAVKDIIHTAEYPTGMGSALYDGWRPRANAPAVDALLEAGAIVLGKTRTTEFAIGRATVTRNPHDASRSPGGSSSGTAAAVGIGMIAAGLGTQTQGSIIRPASYCGAVGYKPTWGVLPLEGVHPVSGSHDHLGVIAQDVRLAWGVAHCIMDWMPGGAQARLPAVAADLESRPVRRVALLQTAGYQELNAAEQAAFEAGLVKLESAGIQVIRPQDDEALAALCQGLDEVPEASTDMVARDMVWPYADYVRRDVALHLSEKIRNMVQHGRGVTATQYQARKDLRAGLLARLGKLAGQYDAFVLPGSSGVAPEGLDNTGSRTMGVYGSFLGVPTVTLPVLKVGHLPMGLQLMAAPNDDHGLLCRAQWLYERLRS